MKIETAKVLGETIEGDKVFSLYDARPLPKLPEPRKGEKLPWADAE